MNRRRRARYLAAAAPAVAALLVWWVSLGTGWFPDYVLYFRISLAYLLAAVGLSLTAILWLGLILIEVERRRSRAQLDQAREQSAERHRQFLRRLDHELKNPLTALQVETAGLQAGMSAGLQAEALVRLREQAARLSNVVVQLRKLADLETCEIEDEPVDVAALLRDLVEDLRQEMPERAPISLSITDLPWPLPDVRGDADLIYLALRNLLVNAVKFTPLDNLIQVRAYESDRRVCIEVADTGQGIPEGEQPYVWDELFRGQAARGTPGSGLGLALVKTIVERHGGDAHLRSRPGRGTVATLRFPILM